MPIKFNRQFYRSAEFWTNLVIVSSLLISHDMILNSTPIVKYSLILAMLVLLVSLIHQCFRPLK